MRTNKVEFPSKKEAQQLKKSILDFFTKKPSTFCFSYEWMMGIVEPKTESEYIQNMFRFSTQGIVRRCDVYLPKVIEHAGKEYVVRLESYGDSKKTRMQAGVNPLAFAFGKVMLDYVYVFLEKKTTELEGKMKEKIEKQAEKERYYTAIQNITAFEGIFGKKMDKKKKEYQQKCDQQKKTISNALLSIKNMQLNVDISKSNPLLSKKNEDKNEKTDGKNKKKGNKESEKKEKEEEEEVDYDDKDEEDIDNEEDIDMDGEDDAEDDDEEEEDSIDEEEEAKMIAEQIKLIKQQNKQAKEAAAKPKSQSENSNGKPKSNGDSNKQQQDHLPQKKKQITKDNNNKGKKNQNGHSNNQKKNFKKK